MYYFLGISLLLAFLFALNILLSAAAAVLWRVIENFVQNWSARNRVRVIFSLRVFPTLFAFVFVFALLIPSYLLFEIHSPSENVTAKIIFPALFSIIGIGVAFYRIFGTFWRTHRLVKNWIKLSEPVQIENVSLPVYRIRHPFPVIAVVGAFRTKMFIAEQVFSSLDEKELAAAVFHECGHLTARDNFKQILLRICRDLLVFPFGKTLDRAWAENAEAAADEYAAQTGGNPAALNLAAALVKIARIVPENATPAMPLGAFLIEKQNADVTWRVRRLIKLAESVSLAEKTFSANLNFVRNLIIPAIFLMILITATNHGLLHKVHLITEIIVKTLQ